MTWGSQNTEAEAHAQLNYAFEVGINFLDTAGGVPMQVPYFYIFILETERKPPLTIPLA